MSTGRMLRSNECPQDECCRATNVHRTNVAEQRMPKANVQRTNVAKQRMSSTIASRLSDDYDRTGEFNGFGER